MERAIQVLVYTIAVFTIVVTAACSDDGGVEIDAGIEIDAPPQVGTLSLEWNVENAGTPLTCAQVGGLTVRVTATPAEGGFATPEAFTCDTLGGMSMEIDSGTYNVSVELVASGNQSLGEPQMFPAIEIETGQNTALGTVLFDVVPEGNIAFTMNAQEAAGNCELQANGGAEIQEIEIQLLGADSACVPISFTIAAGANLPGGTYETDCAGARYAMCVDSDQEFSAQNIPSGATSMMITAYRGGVACYSRMPQFNISGGGLTTTLLPQLLMPTGDCDLP